MEKIDWTKPIEDMDGMPCLVDVFGDPYAKYPARVKFPNGPAIWLDAYGRWENYQVRNVAEVADAEIPQHIYQRVGEVEMFKSGATLRDQFAMAALTGLIFGKGYCSAVLVDESYDIADAMLEARNK